MAGVRAFVAVDLPDEVRAALGRTQAALARLIAGRAVRWTNPEGIHLTLKFLGNVPEEQIPDITTALRAAYAGQRSLLIETAGLGSFPSRGPARVLWAGLAGEMAALAALQRRVEAVLAPLGFPPEGRVFAPHLTLGRLREGATTEEQRAAVQALGRVPILDPLPIPVRRLTLFESRLLPGGAVYQALAHVETEPSGN